MPELSAIVEPPHHAEWPLPNGERLALSLNLDHVTKEFLDRMEMEVVALAQALAVQAQSTANRKGRRTATATSRRKKTTAANAANATANAEDLVSQRLSFLGAQSEKIEFWARILGGEPGNTDPGLRVIAGWDLTLNGEPVEPTYEFLVRRSFGMLQRLYTYCVFEAGTPKKKEPKNSETSGDTSLREES